MYLFFDLGSTLIDESLCDRQLILDTVDGLIIPAPETEEGADKKLDFVPRFFFPAEW